MGQDTQYMHYLPDGTLAFKWDTRSCTLESFTAMDEFDSLVEIFNKQCPERTVIQHYGQGPVYSVFHTKNDGRDGEMTFYDRDGTISGQGKYSDGNRKSGIWTFNYRSGEKEKRLYLSWLSRRGISVTYTLIPASLVLALLLSLLYLFARFNLYTLYFKGLGLVTLIAVPSIFYLAYRFSGPYYESVLDTLLTFVLLLSAINMCLGRKLPFSSSWSLFFFGVTLLVLLIITVIGSIAVTVPM